LKIIQGYLPPLLFPLSARSLHLAFKTGRQLGGYTSGNKGISQSGFVAPQ